MINSREADLDRLGHLIQAGQLYLRSSILAYYIKNINIFQHPIILCLGTYIYPTSIMEIFAELL